MTTVIWAVVILVSLILQATLLPLIAIHGIRPDLLLIVVVSSSLLLGKDQGVAMGFFSGLLQDLSSGNIFGLNTLSKLTTGYFFGMAERKVFKEHILLPLMSVLIATLLNGAVMLLILYTLGYKVDLIPAILHNLLPLVVYNMVFSIPIHHVIYRLSQLQRH